MDDAPRYVFHHIPKCAGNSVKQSFLKSFVLIEDYAHKGPLPQDHETPDDFAARRMDLEGIHWDALPPRLLTGHFELPGCRLFERYPEVYRPPYRLITFLRDPLARAISYFYFSRKSGRFPIENANIEDFILSLNNPVANLIAPQPERALDWLFQFWFVGTMEHLEKDMNELETKIDHALAPIGHKNPTGVTKQPLDPSVVAQFRHQNGIDQTLYEWAFRQRRDPSAKTQPQAGSLR